MRKYGYFFVLAIGILIGIAFTASVGAYAGSSGSVGKKVLAEATVTVDGKALNVKAVNIDGSTYTPNRVLADALGLNIDFKDNTVQFTHKDGGGNLDSPTGSSPAAQSGGYDLQVSTPTEYDGEVTFVEVQDTVYVSGRYINAGLKGRLGKLDLQSHTVTVEGVVIPYTSQYSPGVDAFQYGADIMFKKSLLDSIPLQSSSDTQP